MKQKNLMICSLGLAKKDTKHAAKEEVLQVTKNAKVFFTYIA